MQLRSLLVLVGMVLSLTMLATEIEARGGRGGGGMRGGGARPSFSRGGGAQMGSIGRGSRGGYGGGSMGRPSQRPSRESRPEMGGGRDRPGWGAGQGRPERPSQPGLGERPTPENQPARPENMDPQDRADRVNDARDRRNENVDPADQSDREDAIRERRDNVREEYHEHQEYWHNQNIYVGMVVYPSTFNSYSCTRTTVVESGVTYTQCGTYWYQRRYVGGSISYIVVDAPAGH